MIDAYLTESATLLIPAPPGDWMEKPAPSERAIRVRANFENKRVVGPEGEEVVSNVNFMTRADENIYFDHKIRFLNIEYQIVSIDRKQDLSVRHLIVYVA